MKQGIDSVKKQKRRRSRRAANVNLSDQKHKEKTSSIQKNLKTRNCMQKKINSKAKLNRAKQTSETPCATNRKEKKIYKHANPSNQSSNRKKRCRSKKYKNGEQTMNIKIGAAKQTNQNKSKQHHQLGQNQQVKVQHIPINNQAMRSQDVKKPDTALKNNLTDQQVYAQLTDKDKEDIYEQEDSESNQTHMAKALHAYKDSLDILDFDQQTSSMINESKSGLRQLIQSDITPTYREIHQVIELFKQKFPHKDIDKIISQLYVSLIQKQSNGKDIQHGWEEKLKYHNMDSSSLFNQDFEDNMRVIQENTKIGKLKRYIRNPSHVLTFASEEDQIKFRQKQIVAKAFCNKGYGIQKLNTQIKESGSKITIQQHRYKTLAACVVNDAYRKLEEFLIQECHRSIKPLNRDEIRTIHTTLLNCNQNFQSEQCLTFHKFMKIAFGIGSVTVTEQSAIKLYIVIQKSLKSRIGEMQLDRMNDTMRCNKEFKAKRSFQNQRFQLHKIWTNQLEIQLLEMYKRTPELRNIRDYFKHKFPQNQHLFTIDSLRSRFHKILRVALRKVNCFCQKFGHQRIPNLIRLNDLKVKFVLRSPQALTARRLLVDMYLNDECDIKRLYQTVSEVNEFIIMKDNERMNQFIQAEPLINSATEKVQHNVTISKNKKTNNKIKQKDEVIFKGQEMNFDHIVQVQNGKNLHYYRKVESLPNQAKAVIKNTSQNEVKSQQQGSKITKEETNYRYIPTNNQSEQDESMKSYERPIPPGGQVYINPETPSNQILLQMIIREEMKKYIQLGSVVNKFSKN